MVEHVSKCEEMAGESPLWRTISNDRFWHISDSRPIKNYTGKPAASKMPSNKMELR